MTSTESTDLTTTPYRVLARKYRPRHFDELIGQDALVRTLKNAIESGRIAHAFMLTGVRGVGKTTTARIIARALNYTGPDGKSGPTTGPTDDCAICRSIAEDRHPDVMEMDAASRTGVDDIREILDGVRYAPVSARYKIYIIDEVHMLSKAAFNALLKTLEEPPAHVKFIFATTEIRKVPVTVLSRCQRFDLRRVDADVLSSYFTTICEKENVTCEAAGIDSIARAADGSVRDGLSLLDQAIALGQGQVTGDDVTRMLGLSDRSLTLSLFSAAMSGDVAEALTLLERQHQAGTDPLVSLQDLMETAHDLTLLKALNATEDALKHTALPHAEAERAQMLARNVSMPALQRAWTLLLKGLRDAQIAPDTRHAAEMAIMRLVYAADLPDPARLIREIESGTANVRGGGSSSEHPTGQSVHAPHATQGPAPVMLKAVAGGGGIIMQAPQPEMMVQSDVAPMPQNFEEMILLCEDKGELLLASQLINHVHPVSFESGRIEIRPTSDAPANLSSRLGKYLQEWTGQRWMLTVSSAEGLPTLSQRRNIAKAELRQEVLDSPDVKAVMDIFTGAELRRIIEDK